jgi:hypothetical protein
MAGKRRAATANCVPLLAAALVGGFGTLNPQKANAQMTERSNADPAPARNHLYVGMWVTEDGHVRQELLPNGRYDEARERGITLRPSRPPVTPSAPRQVVRGSRAPRRVAGG